MPVPQIGEDVTALMPDIGSDVTALMSSPEPEPAGEERTWTDTAVDALPIVGGVLGGIVGAPLGPLAVSTAAIGGAGGEGFRRAINSLRGKTNAAEETPGRVLRAVGEAGVEQGAAQGLGMGVARGVQLAGRGAMRGALGAQSALRRKFPTVDLEAVALREGVGLPGANIAGKAKAAHEGVSAAGRAADAAGAPKIQPREMTRGLRKLYDQAGKARQPGIQQQIVEEAGNVRKTFRGGVPVDDAMAVKSEWAAQSREAMQGAANPKSASTNKKVLASLSRSTGDAVKTRSPEIASALTRSQEMMALEKALQAMSTPSGLRMLVSGASGVGSGITSGDPVKGLAGAASTYALTSPQGLGLLAQLLSRSAPAAKQAPRGLMALLASHEDDK